MKINAQYGIVPETAAERKRAAEADLGTLPLKVQGTNCGNCMYFQKSAELSPVPVGYCAHKLVAQPVTPRMCCCFWDAKGFIRASATR